MNTKNRLLRTFIALIAAAGLVVTTACDPEDFEPAEPDDPPEQQQPAVDEQPEQQQDPEDVRGVREAEDLEGAWEQTLDGTEQLRSQIAEEAERAGEDVDEALDEFEDRLRDFEDDIADLIDDYTERDGQAIIEGTTEPHEPPVDEQPDTQPDDEMHQNDRAPQRDEPGMQ